LRKYLDISKKDSTFASQFRINTSDKAKKRNNEVEIPNVSFQTEFFDILGQQNKAKNQCGEDW
jgi:hypothetical protein